MQIPQTREEAIDFIDESLKEYATRHINGTTTLRLEIPIGTKKKPINEITVAMIRAKQMRSFNEDLPAMDQFLTYAEELANLTRNQVDALGPMDTQRLVALIGQDFAGGPASGG